MLSYPTPINANNSRTINQYDKEKRLLRISSIENTSLRITVAQTFIGDF